MVLAKALEVWNLSLQPLDAPDMRVSAEHPEQEDAFICNLQEHWFTIRRVYGDFWNFNSLFPAPQPLSQFYLSAFLATLREQGYTIFVVKGPLSQQQNEDAGQPDSHGAWFTPEQAKAANAQASDARQQGYLMAALQGALDKAKPGGNLISLKRRGSGAVGSSPAAAGEWEQWPEEAAGGSTAGEAGHANEDNDMQRAIAASLADPDQGTAATPSTSQPSAPAQSASASTAQQIQATGPAAVAAVRAMQATTASASPSSSQGPTALAQNTQSRKDDGVMQALGDEPSAGEGVLELAFRLPDNKRLQRRFSCNDPMSTVAVFLRQSGLDMQRHVIIRSFPRKSLTSMDEALKDAGLGDKEMLIVDVQR